MISLFLAIIDDESEKEMFTRIFNDYEKPMWYVANKYLKDEFLADDAVQNALLGVARNMKTVKKLTEEELRPYLFVSARNAALDIQKKEKRFMHGDIELMYDISDEITSGDIKRFEEQAFLLSVLKKVTPTYRDVMYMNLILGLSAKEIGKNLGITSGNVRQRLLRGRKQFTYIYNSEMNPDEDE